VYRGGYIGTKCEWGVFIMMAYVYMGLNISSV
jgi:hypothetical protein